MSWTALPTLRSKILRSFLVMILLYGLLGVFLVASVLIASGTTPKMLHVNYDSIADALQMKDSWNALRHPEDSPAAPTAEWKGRFENALIAEEGNITEPGERELAQKIRKDWQESARGEKSDGAAMNRLLDQLIEINQKAMFNLARDNAELSRRVLVGSLVYFLLSLVLSVFLADGLAGRLSRPIKAVAEALHGRPAFGKRLKLPEPRNLEMLILIKEITALWERTSESQQVNVRALLEQKNKLETVLKSVEDALLVVDGNGVVSHCNDCMQMLIGLPLSEIVGKYWTDLSTATDNYLKLRAVLEPGGPEPVDGLELELEFKGGRRQYSARARDIAGSDACLYLLHDITEKRQREKFRAEFVDLLSHELKTPLQSLGTACENLREERDCMSQGAQLMLDTIIEDLDRIRAVANEFVQVTQSQSKVMKLRMQSIALNQTLPEWLKPFHVVARDRKVRLRFEQEGSPSILANIDAVKFPWVISNLLSNAIRFSPPEGEVVVGLTDRNGAVEIYVLDEGPGVSEEDQRRIFEPFFQGAHGLMPTTSGLRGLFGVGLTIAKEVVEAHEGRIEYYGRKPHGSDFRIILPFPPGSTG